MKKKSSSMTGILKSDLVVDSALALQLAEAYLNKWKNKIGFEAWGKARVGNIEPACVYSKVVYVWIAYVVSGQKPCGYIYVSAAKLGDPILGCCRSNKISAPPKMSKQLIETGSDFFQILIEIGMTQEELAQAMKRVKPENRAQVYWETRAQELLGRESVSTGGSRSGGSRADSVEYRIPNVTFYSNVYGDSDPHKNCFIGPTLSILHYYDSYTEDNYINSLNELDPYEVQSTFDKYDTGLTGYHYQINQILVELAHNHLLISESESFFTARGLSLHTSSCTYPHFSRYQNEIDHNNPVFLSPRSVSGVDLEQWNRTGYGYLIDDSQLWSYYAITIHPGGEQAPYEEILSWWLLCAYGGAVITFHPLGVTRNSNLVSSLYPINPYVEEPVQNQNIRIRPGESKPVPLCIFNTGNVALDIYLSSTLPPENVTTSPDLASSTGSSPFCILSPGSSMQAELTLTVDSAAAPESLLGNLYIQVRAMEHDGNVVIISNTLTLNIYSLTIPQIDQEQTRLSTLEQSVFLIPIGKQVSAAQEIAHTGSNLAGLSLPLCRYGDVTGNLIVEIRSKLTDTVPLKQIKINGSRLPLVMPTDVNDWWLEYFDQPINNLPAGNVYIVLRVPDGSADQFGWGLSLSDKDAYSAGQGYGSMGTGWLSNPNLIIHWDMAFRTYTTAPSRKSAGKKKSSLSTSKSDKGGGLPVGSMRFISLLGLAGWPQVTMVPIPLAVAKGGSIDLSAEGQSLTLAPNVEAQFNMIASHFPSGKTVNCSKRVNGPGSAQLTAQLPVSYSVGALGEYGSMTVVLMCSAKALLPIPLAAQGHTTCPVITDQISTEWLKKQKFKTNR